MRLKILLAPMLICSFAFGITISEIDTTTGTKLEAVLKILQDNTTDTGVKSQKVFAIFDELFDFEQMAKNCLGKAQWDTLSPEQKDEFMDKFVKRLRESYADKLKLYTDQKIELEKSTQTSPTRVQLPMFLVGSDNKKYDILYKFYDTKKEKGWLIYDVDILGVSITQTYRSQLDGALKNGTFEDLIQKIDSINLDEQIQK
jgi:phospholipid transport system substrate-binding protein